MNDDLERRLRVGLHEGLPPAPDATRVFLERLPLDHPSVRARIRLSRASVAAAIVIVGIGIVAMASMGGMGRSVDPSAGIASPSITALPSTTSLPSPSPAPSDTPNALAGLTVHSVSELLELRSGGHIGGEPVALRGFWSDRGFGHSCVPPDSQPGELQIRCHDGEFGITERDEPIGTLTVDGRFVPHEGPALTPYVEEALAQRLFTLPYVNGQYFHPVPIVVVGHFDDPRADLCQPEARERCRDRFVIDQVVEFDPHAVPTPGVTPSPSPFPFDDPPPAPFTAKECLGDVPYSFVGWGRLSDYDLDIGTDDVLYLMVTRGQEELSGHMARWICYAHEWERGIISFATIP
jgi:hypothetical protein